MKRAVLTTVAVFSLFSLFSQIAFQASFTIDRPDRVSSSLFEDLDGDGLNDLLLVDRDENLLLISHNSYDGQGSISAADFEAPITLEVDERASNLRVKDLDMDGKPEILLSNGNFDGTISIFQNFTEPGSIAASDFTLWGELSNLSGTSWTQIVDVNNDLYPDIVVAYANDGFMSIYLNETGEGGIEFSNGIHLPANSVHRGLTCDDFDGDGNIDCLISISSGEELMLYRNGYTEGELALEDFTVAWNVSFDGEKVDFFRITDINLDGEPDLIIGTQDDNVRIYQNISIPGSIAFSDEISFTYPDGLSDLRGIETADLDNNGSQDLAILFNEGQTVVIYKNDQPQSEDITSAAYSVVDMVENISATTNGITIIDIDGDGRKDIYSNDLAEDVFHVFLNQSTLSDLEEMDVESIVHYFPNPVDEQLNVSLPENFVGATIAIYSAVGQKLMSKKVGNKFELVDTSQLHSGLYILQIQRGETIYNKKFVKE